MAGRYDRINGAWTKERKRYDKVNGVWVPVKARFDKVNGAWSKSYVGADCHETVRTFRLNEDGSLYIPYYTSGSNYDPAFNLIFDDVLNFPVGQRPDCHLNNIKVDYISSCRLVAYGDANCNTNCQPISFELGGMSGTQTIDSSVSLSMNGTYTTISTNILYFEFSSDAGNGGISLPPGGMVICGKQIRSVEIL